MKIREGLVWLLLSVRGFFFFFFLPILRFPVER